MSEIIPHPYAKGMGETDMNKELETYEAMPHRPTFFERRVIEYIAKKFFRSEVWRKIIRKTVNA